MNANPMVVVDLMAYDNSIVDYHFATPADIAVAHPKCETCEHCKQARDWTGMPATFFNGAPLIVCDNATSPSFRANITPAIDYCRHHPKLNTDHDDEATHG